MLNTRDVCNAVWQILFLNKCVRDFTTHQTGEGRITVFSQNPDRKMLFVFHTWQVSNQNMKWDLLAMVYCLHYADSCSI